MVDNGKLIDDQAFHALQHPLQKRRFVLALIFALLLFPLIAVGLILGTLVLVVPLFGVLLWISGRMLFAGYLGNSILASNLNYPRIYLIGEELKTSIGYKKTVNIFVYEQGNFNASLMKFFFYRRAVFLNSELLESGVTDDELRWLIGRFIGYLRARRQAGFWGWTIRAAQKLGVFNIFLLPYERALVYSGDRLALAVVDGDISCATSAMQKVFVGRQLGYSVNPEGIVDQQRLVKGSLFAFLARILSGFPHMTTRYVDLIAFAKSYYPAQYARFEAGNPGVPTDVLSLGAVSRPSSTLWIVSAAAAAAVLIIGTIAAAGWYFASHWPVVPQIAPPTQSDADKKQEEAEAARSNRQDLLKASIAKADKYAAAQQWSQAIAGYAFVQKAFPESEEGRQRLRSLLEKIQSEPDALSEENFETLRDSLTEAANLDEAIAMELLGDLLRDRDPRASFDWLWSAAMHGQAHAMSKVGLYFSNGKGVARDFVKAAQCFEVARQSGDVGAGTLLAECYLFGKGVPKNEAMGVNLLREAVGADDPRAMDQLGNCYHKGIGVVRDDREAFRLFKAAASLNYLDSKGNLGVIYLTSPETDLGTDEVLRTQEALDLFRDGAKQKNALCMYLYARCFEEGHGVERNPSKARDLYRQAAEAGNPAAQEWCRKYNIRLTTDQVP